MITLGALLPHPPIMVPGIGKEEDLATLKDTIASMKEVDRLLGQDLPETIVVFTPHGAVFSDALIVYSEPVLAGNLQRFGLNKTWKWENDLELMEEINALGEAAGLPVYKADKSFLMKYQRLEGIDHGVIVPLSYLESIINNKVKLVVVPLSFLPLEELYRFGAVIRDAAQRLNRKIAVIASGDLSHSLQPNSPAGYDPRGAEFDKLLMQLIKQQALEEFFEIDPVLQEKAAECGFRSLIMLLGTMDETSFQATAHSYQGPFGVGYGVASFKPNGHRKSISLEIVNKRKQHLLKKREAETPLVKFARSIVESYAKGESLPKAEEMASFSHERAGVFVSIKKHGQLRGCIGTTEPTQPNIIDEVRQNAISASTRDPRFSPIGEDELVDLSYSVDVLKPAEKISSIEELDPKRYGVIVSKGYRRGLLLPNLEGVETVDEQVAIAKQKAGIAKDEKVDLERFEVIRYH